MRPFLFVASAVVALYLVQGCADPETVMGRGVAPKSAAAYIRIVNMSDHDADFKLDGRLVGTTSPAKSEQYQIVSPKPHKVEVDVPGAKFDQSVAVLSGQTATVVVTEPGKGGPVILSGESHVEVHGKATIQAISFPEPGGTLKAAGTDVSVASGTTLNPAISVDPGTIEWSTTSKEGAHHGTVDVGAAQCCTVFVGGKDGATWIIYHIPK